MGKLGKKRLLIYVTGLMMLMSCFSFNSVVFAEPADAEQDVAAEDEQLIDDVTSDGEITEDEEIIPEAVSEGADDAIEQELWTIIAEDVNVNMKEKGPFFVDASTAEEGSEIIYECMDETIAEVDESTGEITPLKAGTTTVMITASANEEYAETTEEINLKVYTLAAPKIYAIRNVDDGIYLDWSENLSSKGYNVYRRPAIDKATAKAMGEEEEAARVWEKAFTVSDHGIIKGTDYDIANGGDVENGKFYEYAVTAFKGKDESLMSNVVKEYYLTVPENVKLKKKTSTSKTASWSKNSKATGYYGECSLSRTIISPKTKTVKSYKTLSYTFTKLKKNKTYYARVRAYKKIDGVSYYSAWGFSYLNDNWGQTQASGTDKIDYNILRRKGKIVDVPIKAGQTASGSSIMQGGCTDGTYGYYALINKRGTEKIAKVKLSTGEVVKVSSKLSPGLDHANDMTYDYNHKRIVVVNNANDVTDDSASRKRLTFVDPKTLKSTGYKDVKIPSSMPGANAEQVKSIGGFCAMGYSRTKDQYVTLISSTHDLMISDSKFNPIRYVSLEKQFKTINSDWYCQGIEVTKHYVLVCVSPRTDKGINYNSLLIYDWNGKYMGTVRVRVGCEIENVFHIGNRFYTNFYTYSGGKRHGYIYKMYYF